MSTQYHVDNMIYTSREEIKNIVKNDWYKRYNKYMIRDFFYIGRKFEYEGKICEVLDNNVQVSQSVGWLHIKTVGQDSYKFVISPRKILLNEPILKNELDESLEGENISLEINEDHEQLQLF